MPAQKSLRGELIAYFQNGCKTDQKLNLGLEVEHFLTERDGTPISFAGVESLMRALQQPGDTPILIDGLYMGYYNDTFGISLEPACQIEISVAPLGDVDAILAVYNTWRAKLAPLLAARGLVLWSIGCHPTRSPADLPLIPKHRYAYMDRWFRASGGHGIHMMRATASTQLSIDYFSEEDFIRKYRAASLLGPLFALLTDNAPFYEGAPNSKPSRRTEIWRDVDPARCGTFSGLMDPGFGFAAYADYLLQVPLIVEKHGDATAYAGAKTAPQCYTAPYTKADLEQILSMVFLDVRLKNYIEIRMADSMPADAIRAYAALIGGIFSQKQAVDAVLARYGGCTVAEIETAKQALCRAGWGAVFYGRPAAAEAEWLLSLPGAAASKALAPFAELVKTRTALHEKELSLCRN